jgi:hypothetical protein
MQRCGQKTTLFSIIPISWLSAWWLSASIMAMPKNWYKMARMGFG